MGFNLFLIPIVFFGVIILLSSFFIVKQQTAVIIERFGKFHSIRQSGLQMKIPLIDRIAARMGLKIQQLDVIVETKTLDDVFVKLKVSVQYVVIKEKVYEAFYKLEFPHEQITSYVFDVVRAEVPKMKLDDVFGWWKNWILDKAVDVRTYCQKMLSKLVPRVTMKALSKRENRLFFNYWKLDKSFAAPEVVSLTKGRF